MAREANRIFSSSGSAAAKIESKLYIDYNASPLFVSENASSDVWQVGTSAAAGAVSTAASLCGNGGVAGMELKRDLICAPIKTEPGHAGASGVPVPAPAHAHAAHSTHQPQAAHAAHAAHVVLALNGHAPNKRARTDDWLAVATAASPAPLTPSPGPPGVSYAQSSSAVPPPPSLSNGYSSPLSSGSYDPYSPNGKIGREELSPAGSVNGGAGGGGADGEARRGKKGPAPRQQEELCLVCGDRASGYHYNALTCEGCKGFFRRSVTKNAVYICKFGHECEMDMYMRRKCQECRLKKCLAVGMRPECVVPENQCAIKRKEKKAQRERDKPPVSTTSPPIDVLPAIMKCDPLPPEATKVKFLTDKLLAENRLRNVPPLTPNQEYVIARLVWYQDGYEQPSEDDLKRIMINSDDDDDEHEVPFRHITEMTILTVQLIVEFAKGLPAFTKITQADQITLLKACSSEVMMLRVARRYDAASDSILFADNRPYTRDNYKVAGMSYVIDDLLHFCRHMYNLTVDNVEYALLTAIVIFSDRPGLEEVELVEQIQSYYIQTLKSYIMNRHSGDAKCNLLLAKLLSTLTELRTLGMQNSNMCISLKLKNRKLPKFLEEIWDVTEVGTTPAPLPSVPAPPL